MAIKYTEKKLKRRMNKILCVLSVTFLVLSCKQDKLKNLTNDSCKLWDLYEIKPKGQISEKRNTVSMLFCKNGRFVFYYLRNGKRIKKTFSASHQDMIPSNKWIYKHDTLLVNGMSSYLIKKLKEDTLVLQNTEDDIFRFTTSKKGSVSN